MQYFNDFLTLYTKINLKWIKDIFFNFILFLNFT